MMKFSLILALGIVAKGQQLSLSDTDLRPYDGSDSSKPIYLAINGTIYDVSASPAFYGPGGAYHHFAGRDASRAWVTECWDSEDQLTWRMDGLEKMFMARYLDEEFEKVGEGGELDLNLGGLFPRETIEQLAKRSLESLGKVSEEEKAKRRSKDAEAAQKKIHEKLAHWAGFFANNDKYGVVGKVIHDENTSPTPPALCAAAMEKRPIEGGKLDALVSVASMAKKADNPDGEKGEEDLPEVVKKHLMKDEL